MIAVLYPLRRMRPAQTMPATANFLGLEQQSQVPSPAARRSSANQKRSTEKRSALPKTPLSEIGEGPGVRLRPPGSTTRTRHPKMPNADSENAENNPGNSQDPQHSAPGLGCSRRRRQDDAPEPASRRGGSEASAQQRQVTSAEDLEQGAWGASSARYSPSSGLPDLGSMFLVPGSLFPLRRCLGGRALVRTAATEVAAEKVLQQ
jgi:hypothetical protein